MLKITTSKLLIVLLILVGIFFIIKYTSNKNRSKSFKTELVNIDTSKVSKIEIEDPEGSLVLSKTNSKWTVATETGDKNAMSNTIGSMLVTLNSIEPSRIASRSEDKWQDFSVDSTGTRVKVYDGNNKLLDIILGRFGVEGQRSFYTYVRLTEDVDTYVANNFMKMSISTRSEDFRNNSILRLDPDSLSTISFNYPDSSLVLARSGNIWYNGIQKADSAATSSYLQGLRFVTSRSFVEAENPGTPVLNVVFGFTDKPEIQISAYQREDGWLMESSENGDEYWVDSAQFEKIFAATSIF